MTARREIVEPGWCTGEHVHSITLPLHQSQVVMVGPFPIHAGTGVAAMWLKSGANGPATLALRVAHMASAEISLSLDDARRLRTKLSQLIEQAEQG